MTDVPGPAGGTPQDLVGEPADVAAPSDEPRRSSWGRYVLTKAAGAAVSLLMVVVLGFFAFRVLPGDPAITMTRGRRVSADEVERLRQEFGLDGTLLEQFWRYLTDLVRGDLGTSFVYGRPVADLIAERVGSTLLLTGSAAALAIVLGLWLGQRAAWRRGSLFDKANTGIALVLWSVPTFWLGLLLLMLLGGTFPTAGMVTPGRHATGLAWVLDVLWHLVLPVLTMTAVTYAQYLMNMRSSMLEEMTADYLTTARAKGLNEDGVRSKHAVPNALLPTVTIIFMTLGHLIGGAITVETVFSWPGLGYLTYQALGTPDLPVLQGTFVVFSSIVVIMNFVADLVYRVLDPRLKAA